MKNLSHFIKSLKFEYAVSYSGLRGEVFEKLVVENNNRIQLIEEEIKTARFMEKSRLRKEVESLSDEINIYNSRVIKKSGTFHKSAKPIYRFEKGDDRINKIFEVLNSKFTEQHFWMCPLTFRDSIVFYSKEDEIVGILQICFSCEWMKNEQEEDLEVDHKIFPSLKKVLIDLGHKIKDS